MYGLGSFNTTNNFPPSGSPFTAGSADNGLSVDPGTGKIVMGNDNDFLMDGTAKFLSPRKIYINGQSIHLLDDPGGAGNEVDVTISAGNVGVTALGAGGSANLTAGTGIAGTLFLGNAGFAGLNPTVQFDIGGAGTYSLTNIAGNLQVKDTAVNSFLSINALNDAYQFGDINGKAGTCFFLIDSSNGRIEFFGGGSRIMELLPFTRIAQFGDIDSAGLGLIAKVDAFTQQFDLRNTALNAIYSCNGQLGITGTQTPVTSITVEGGLIVAMS